MIDQHKTVFNTLNGTEFAKNWHWSKNDLYTKITLGEVRRIDSLGMVNFCNEDHSYTPILSLEQLLDAMVVKGWDKIELTYFDTTEGSVYKAKLPESESVAGRYFNADSFYIAVFKAFCHIYEITVRE